MYSSIFGEPTEAENEGILSPLLLALSAATFTIIFILLGNVFYKWCMHRQKRELNHCRAAAQSHAKFNMGRI